MKTKLNFRSKETYTYKQRIHTRLKIEVHYSYKIVNTARNLFQILVSASILNDKTKKSKSDEADNLNSSILKNILQKQKNSI